MPRHRISRRSVGHLVRAALLGLAWPLSTTAADASGCVAESALRMPLLVELYTSEGCSSCPPADRWLSALKSRSDVVALGFHVHYWDRLGWTDRLASPEHTQRQLQQQRSNGARYAYTPQVVVDGRDQPGWRTLPLPSARPAATVQLKLQRDGLGYSAIVQPLAGAPARLAGFWAVTEDGHVSRVGAGENSGATLKHDFVVREYASLGAWPMQGAATLRFTPASLAAPQHPRRLNLVLVDADSGRPVQALALGC